MTSKTLTIFEGPDGAGKSIAAREYADAIEARYVHFSSMPCVGPALGRMYVEAMLPALLGYQDVVFDRSWLSEMPYGRVYRHGSDRLGLIGLATVERLAMRCGALVIDCDPPYRLIKESYIRRKHLEMLDNEDQLRQVYDLYRQSIAGTSLPVAVYDYSIQRIDSIMIDEVTDVIKRYPRHPLDFASAGNWDAKVVLVGESFGRHKDIDSLYQWPFASFNGRGMSRWLTAKLLQAGINERDLLWVNADQDIGAHLHSDRNFIALGRIAHAKLSDLGFDHQVINHPQSWKRFHISEEYPLLNMIKELLA